jgi:methyltransferase (TIGR00027 family)
MAMLVSLKRVVYQVPDLEAAKQWYSSFLNLAPLFDSPFVVIYQINNCSLSLQKGREPLPENSERLTVFWEVDDIDATYKRVLSLGGTVHSEIKNVLSIQVAQVKDPFGNIIGLSGKQASDIGASVEQKPSESAMAVAYCRALAAYEDREEVRGPDLLAELFLSEEKRKSLLEPATRRMMVSRFISSPLYGYFISRTAFGDAMFKQALQDQDIAQIVLLGAGYDTRAFRSSPINKGTVIFEVDVPTTQQNKIQILEKEGVPIPDYITFVAMNFKTDVFEDVMGRSGFDAKKKTLFIWEGVSYYLAAQAVDSTLHFIKTCSARGSWLCFDYLTQKMVTVNAGEPFLFWIEKDRIETFLAKRGFKMIEHIDAAEMEKRYLTLADGSLAEKSLPMYCLVHATTV